MKKLKLSQAEKSLICAFLIFLIIQVVLVGLVIITLDPIEPDELKNAEITVDKVYYYKHSLIIYDGADRYLIKRAHGTGEAPPRKLEQMISIGDTLSVKYYEYNNIYFHTRKEIVDARSDTEVYRSLDAFYQSQKVGVPIAITVYCIIELLLIGGLLLYIFLYKNVAKDFQRKLKRRFSKKPKHRRCSA